MDAVNVTTIICSDCGAELEPTDETCRQCGRRTAKQQGSESKEKLNQLLDRPWVIVVLILHVGLLGIPVYWKTRYSLGARLFLVLASIAYTVGAVIFIVFTLQWMIHLVTGG
jgi:ribosomal protein L40E